MAITAGGMCPFRILLLAVGMAIAVDAGAKGDLSAMEEVASLEMQRLLDDDHVAELYHDAPFELRRELELSGIAFDIERMVNASKEYIAAGEFAEGLKPDPGTRFYEDHPVFNFTDARNSEYDVACFRIPAIIQVLE